MIYLFFISQIYAGKQERDLFGAESSWELMKPSIMSSVQMNVLSSWTVTVVFALGKNVSLIYLNNELNIQQSSTYEEGYLKEEPLVL